MGVATWLERAVNQSASQETDRVLVAASAAHKVRVHWIFFSTTTAMTVMLESGTSTRLWEMYGDVNGGAALIGDPDMLLAETAAGDALTYTTNAAGNHFIAVGYTVINV